MSLIFGIDKRPKAETGRPNGYPTQPGTGPAGETCKSCGNCVIMRKWRKCAVMQGRWTCGRGSDVASASPACSMWKRAD